MRKLALAVAVAMASSRVYALGLGDIELRSALNEPLDADVRLLSAQPGELGNASVRLAPNDEFAQAGIERPAILSDIKFTIVRGKNGTATLNITSTQPIREPFLDFIVQLAGSQDDCCVNIPCCWIPRYSARKRRHRLQPPLPNSGQACRAGKPHRRRHCTGEPGRGRRTSTSVATAAAGRRRMR